MTDEPDRTGADVRAPAHLPPSLTTELELIYREEFSAFYRGFIDKLVGFLILQGARQGDAAEVAQETMIKLWRKWGDVESPAAWTRRVASRAMARRIGDIEEDPIAELEHSALLPAKSDIDEWVERNDYYEALAQLPPRQRQLMVWCREGYEPTEIAEQLQMNPATVRSNLRKARRTLMGTLGRGTQR
ncbi:RNA polymerase sigma factor [Nocardia sp. XZ_19_385]|uniref:RNA polymerase sigma factor n=1 Tax=Nocardia sp. XZ_19_385 TaxID=2769488 RepID=UPI00188ED0BA|nr:sigma-70 family RNA polymerase sigma factor [Nocardia sp. XZ_19_385]